MIYVFSIMIVIGIVFIWPREEKNFRGYREIRVWWINFFGKIIYAIGWFGILFQSQNWIIDEGSAFPIMLTLAVCSTIIFEAVCGAFSEIELVCSVMKDIKDEKIHKQNREKISYRIVKNMYLMHSKDFSWENDFYPLYKKIPFRMTFFDLLRFSFLYSKKAGNKEVSTLMLAELKKDMAKIQEDKEKSILIVNKASNDLAKIMTEMKDN